MNDTKVFFCGLSKKAEYSLIKKNIDFIIDYSNLSKFDIYLIVIDSDSEKIIKDYLMDTVKKNINITVVSQDELEDKIPSRIQRITHCRNLCLDIIYQNNEEFNIVYIPCDFDIDLFTNTTSAFMDSLIRKCTEFGESKAIFPVSQPRYYDILALRAKRWVNYNSQLINSRIKKYLRIGSFFTNYFFVFRHQWKIDKIKNKNIELISAFGGIGIYSLHQVNQKIYYEYSDKFTEFISEHVLFNSYFKHKELNTSWIVNAPNEHINFHKLTPLKKFTYLIKTIKNDVYK